MDVVKNETRGSTHRTIIKSQMRDQPPMLQTQDNFVITAVRQLEMSRRASTEDGAVSAYDLDQRLGTQAGDNLNVMLNQSSVADRLPAKN